MNRKLYIVVELDPCEYDSYDISYHLTRKGALKAIMNYKYTSWEMCGYIHPGSYEDISYYVKEKELHD